MASPPAADAPPLAASPAATALPDPCVPSAATPMASVSINKQMILGGLGYEKLTAKSVAGTYLTKKLDDARSVASQHALYKPARSREDGFLGTGLFCEYIYIWILLVRKQSWSTVPSPFARPSLRAKHTLPPQMKVERGGLCLTSSWAQVLHQISTRGGCIVRLRSQTSRTPTLHVQKGCLCGPITRGSLCSPFASYTAAPPAAMAAGAGGKMSVVCPQCGQANPAMFSTTPNTRQPALTQKSTSLRTSRRATSCAVAWTPVFRMGAASGSTAA